MAGHPGLGRPQAPVGTYVTLCHTALEWLGTDWVQQAPVGPPAPLQRLPLFLPVFVLRPVSMASDREDEEEASW